MSWKPRLVQLKNSNRVEQSPSDRQSWSYRSTSRCASWNNESSESVLGGVGFYDQRKERVAMPAVTVEDLLVLPKIAAPKKDAAKERAVRSVTTAPHGFEGEGFPVRRAFAGVAQADLDPFVHMDQMGEVEYAPGEPKGTPWHPHRGFETVTYMIDGTFRHQDSTGGGGVISDGDTQWMTAGAGILHIETPPEQLIASGGLFHGIQLWVNLPASSKWVSARYQDIGRDRVALAASPDGGALYRVIAGEFAGVKGPGVTYTPITFVHASIEAAASVDLPWPTQQNALIYVLSGEGTVGSEHRPISSGQLVVLGAGGYFELSAKANPSQRSPRLEVLLLGGVPIRESVAWQGPFVMNSTEELRQAFEDYHRGAMGQIPAQHLG